MPQHLDRISLGAATFFMLFLVLPRNILFWVAPGGFENLLGDFMIFQFKSFLFVLGSLYRFFVPEAGNLKLAILVAIAGFIRWIYLILRHRRIWPPELAPILALLILPLQFFADLSPVLFYALTGVLAGYICIRYFFRFPGIWGWLLLLSFCILGLYWLDWAETCSLLLFAATVVATIFLQRRKKLTSAGGTLLLLFVIPLAQCFASWLPVTRDLPESRKFSPRLALSFCESDARKSLFAAHPECPMAMFRSCRQGFLAEYDNESLNEKKIYKPFTNRYWGRPEQIICNKEQLYVSLNETWSNGANIGPNTMIMDLQKGRERILQNLGGPQMGNSLLYDPIHDALFMTSEWNQRIYRWDFKKSKMDTTIGDNLPNPWVSPLTGEIHTGSRVSHHEGYSKALNTAYIADWISGKYVHEIDLTTLKATRKFLFNGGAALGATVDDDLGRLWISHLWGISVFDLASGRLLSKHRAGFINRPAVIDKKNNLVFTGSTVQGRIHVYDRLNGNPRGMITLGPGTRYLFISAEKQRLYAGSVSGSYVFDLKPGSEFISRILKK